jgi:radical SAM-linked protein
MAGEQLRLRVRLTKLGRMRFLSHTEYWRTLMLAARRSGLPLAYAGDYRPRVKVSLSPPLPIGIASDCELVDIGLTSYVPPAEAQRMLSAVLPEGMEVAGCRLMGEESRPVGKMIDTAAYRAFIPAVAGSGDDWSRAVESFMSSDTVNFERVQPRRTRVVDLRPGVHRLEVTRPGDGGRLLVEMLVDDGTRGTIKPWEVLRVLAGNAGLDQEALAASEVRRVGLFTMRGDRFVSPMDVDRRKPATSARGRRERWR